MKRLKGSCTRNRSEQSDLHIDALSIKKVDFFYLSATSRACMIKPLKVFSGSLTSKLTVTVCPGATLDPAGGSKVNCTGTSLGSESPLFKGSKPCPEK